MSSAAFTVASETGFPFVQLLEVLPRFSTRVLEVLETLKVSSEVLDNISRASCLRAG